MQNIGIDIGGTFIKIGVVKDDKVIFKKKIETINNDENKLLLSITTEIDTLLKDYEISSIGIGVAGKVDGGKAIAPNIQTGEIDFKKALETKYNKQIYFDNDANCAAAAEAIYGKLKDTSGVFLTFGTGIGGGIVIDGKIFRGMNGNAGEFGHQIINVDGVSCNCGARGCYEAYASTSALVKKARDMISSDTNVLSTLSKIPSNEIDGKIILETYNNGNDQVVNELVNEHIKFMSIGIINILNLLDVDNVVIGGAISQEQVIIDGIKEYIYKNKTLDRKDKEYNVLAATFQNDAGIIGAANLNKLG